MALNNSGPISLGGSTSGQSIALEIGQSATAKISLNDANVRALANVSLGAITMPTNFYGKSVGPLYNFPFGSSFRFTPCGATGALGPNYATAIARYPTEAYPWLLNTNFFNVVDYGKQIWTVPATALYTIDINGAAGGANDLSQGGYGARVILRNLTLTQGQKLAFIVGQKGIDQYGFGGQNFISGPGGGGGSFAYDNSTNFLYGAAGGGGGAYTANFLNVNTTNPTTAGGQSGTSGTTIFFPGGYIGYGGSNGTGGGQNGYSSSGGGAGWLGDGAGGLIGGKSRLNLWTGGFTAGYPGVNGGYGGGGSSSIGVPNSYAFGGGGGGYSGGAAGGNSGYGDGEYGGGGGSYGAAPIVEINAAANSQQGYIEITRVSG